MKNPTPIFITSFIITLSIFAVAILISLGLDFIREQKILEVIHENEISTESYILEKSFLEEKRAEKCALLSEKIKDLKEQIKAIGTDLNTYRRRTIFKKKDFDYLKRKYFLLELRLYTLTNEWTNECGAGYTPIIFFYEIDDQVSERQGYILDEVSKATNESVIVFSFDISYPDEPSLELIKAKFNITEAPTIIINNSFKKQGIFYSREILSYTNPSSTYS